MEYVDLELNTKCWLCGVLEWGRAYLDNTHLLATSNIVFSQSQALENIELLTILGSTQTTFQIRNPLLTHDCLTNNIHNSIGRSTTRNSSIHPFTYTVTTQTQLNYYFQLSSLTYLSHSCIETSSHSRPFTRLILESHLIQQKIE